MRFAHSLAFGSVRSPLNGDPTWPGYSDVIDFIGGTYRKAGARVADAPSIPGWSFSRASVGYAQKVDGTLQSFASGTPRITDKGMLGEEARTNALLRSQEFDNASWTKSVQGSGVTPSVSANAATAPDGTATADVVTFNCGGTTAGDTSRLRQAATVAAGAVVQISVYLRVASGTKAVILAGNGTGTSPTNPASSITVTTTWQRFTVQATQGMGAPTTISAEVRGAGNVSGGTAFDVEVWGMQMEVGAFATSYIPTTTAGVTRAADVVSISSVTIGSAFTLYGAYTPLYVGQAERIFQADAGADTDAVSLYLTAGGSNSALAVTSSSTVADVGVSGAAANTIYKIAARFQTDNIKAAVNGTLSSADTSATLPTGLTTLRLGGGASGAPVNGYLRSLGIIQSALVDADLQSQTT